MSVSSHASPAARAAHEHELLRRYHEHGDAGAKDQLAAEMLPLARALANRYAGRGEDREDLVQVACIGIMKAIEGFDLDRGVRFSSYAVPTIVGELRRYFRDRTWAVRVPRSLQELHQRVATAREALTNDLGRAPTVGELAGALQVAEEDVLAALQASGARYASSIYEPVGEDLTREDMLGANDPELPRAEIRVLLGSALAVLPERDQRILHLRFTHDMTQTEIARCVGVSQMQVSRIIRQSLTRLREQLASEAPVAPACAAA